MNAAPLSRRPLGCLKTALRQARQQPHRHPQLCRRLASTTTSTTAADAESAATPAEHTFFLKSDPRTHKLRTAFAVYTRTPNTPSVIRGLDAPPIPAASASMATPTPLRTTLSPSRPLSPPPASGTIPPDPMRLFDASQIARMDPTGARTALFSKKNPDAARVGDVLLVTPRRGGEPFAGVLLAVRRSGIETSILLRNQLTKVGVEMWFKVYNRNVAGIEIVKRRARRARRARLTYMRKPRHDMGSVEQYVFAWKKSRHVLTTKAKGGAGAGAAAAGAAGASKKGKKKK